MAEPTPIFLTTVAGEWSFWPVAVALSSGDRLRGIRRVPPGSGLLLWGRSVHGRGLSEGLIVVEIDADGTVVGTGWLRPGGLYVARRAGWLLEVPLGAGSPAIGARLVAGRPAVLAGT